MPIIGAITFILLSIYASPEAMAGMQAIMVLAANVGAVFAQFAVTMGLGAVKTFSENSGYLMAICSIFSVINLICGGLGIHMKEKATPSLDEVDNNDPVADSV